MERNFVGRLSKKTSILHASKCFCTFPGSTGDVAVEQRTIKLLNNKGHLPSATSIKKGRDIPRVQCRQRRTEDKVMGTLTTLLYTTRFGSHNEVKHAPI